MTGHADANVDLIDTVIAAVHVNASAISIARVGIQRQRREPRAP